MKTVPVILAAVLPGIALAALAPEPAVVNKGGFEITPTLAVGLVSDDNFYTEPAGA